MKEKLSKQGKRKPPFFLRCLFPFHSILSNKLEMILYWQRLPCGDVPCYLQHALLDLAMDPNHAFVIFPTSNTHIISHMNRH